MIEAPILAYLIETTNGRMKFDGPDRVLEYGVEADYFEIWERLPGSQGESFALQTGDDPLSLLLGAGEFLIAVRPRSAPLPVAADLATFAAGKNGLVLRQALDFKLRSAGAPRPTPGRSNYPPCHGDKAA